MTWTNIRLIVSREIRDQLRDRRTIFVIAILPLLLYPLLGMTFLQVAQFMKEHPTKIWVIGASNLPESQQLLDGNAFRSELHALPSDDRLFELSTEPLVEGQNASDAANVAVNTGKYDAVVYISDEFAEHIANLPATQEATTEENANEEAKVANPLGPEIFYNVAKDKSRVAHDRVLLIMSRWRTEITQQNQTEASAPPPNVFSMKRHDLSEDGGRRAAIWSKILPFVIIIWAMTGAFYPAIDLCAGEKERGTLETLLSSPASRHEIVFGKLLTVMVFSIATSLLNLMSMGLTGKFVINQLQGFGGMDGLQIGPPPFETIGWLILALIPISALFSALSLALAAMARSSKEGQYYLMPLMLGTMPLMLLPMMPAAELDLGSSLIPVTGVVLLLRSLIEGQYAEALNYTLPVIMVTGICCWLAGLWAIHQFEDEKVLFHESEQFDLKSWLIHLFRDRSSLPTTAQAFMLGVLLLILRFFASAILPSAHDWNGLLLQNVISQVGLIALPAVLLAWFLTRNPRKTLLLQKPKTIHLFLAALLAFVLHPIVSTMSNAIQTLYPVSEQTMAKLESFQGLLGGAPSIWALLLMVAVLPSICEELAFRGFLLSGLRRMKNTTLAILVSSLFFGIAHQLLQQSIAAFVVGMMIGYMSIQTKSIFPCMLYHLIHNSLPLLAASWIGETGGIRGLVELQDGMLRYEWPLVSVCIAAAIVLLWRFQSSSDGDGDERTLPAALPVAVAN